ncbi:MAG: hypothetical protein KIT22_11290 [Verrucomicrobiae bacterium]|nr:hypothetical protein [Verrucomicrobiae bacterium]
MKLGVRIGLYLLLVILAGYFFGRFRSAYHSLPSIAETALEAVGSDATATNEVPVETNAAPEAAVDDGSSTNALSPEATDPSATNALEASTTSAPPAAAAAGKPPEPKAPQGSDSIRSLALFVLFFLALGGLVAWDISQYFGNRAGRAIMAEDWIERKDPQYEKAEEEWSKGNHLDAIALMREYLAKNPREQHVAIRIAEIYEKDLGNHLAAALELEEVLTKRLPKERWGWTAIRLSNLYSGRLSQPDKALALLNRIVTEYPATAAAKKARARLGIPEPEETVETPEAVPATSVAPEVEEIAEEAPPPPPDPEPPSNLPKGFRPKK